MRTKEEWIKQLNKSAYCEEYIEGFDFGYDSRDEEVSDLRDEIKLLEIKLVSLKQEILKLKNNTPQDNFINLVKEDIKFGKFGNIIYEDKDGIWRWKDNNELITVKRPCAKCDMLPIEDDIDPCLGKLEGVQGACCGHGIHNGYIWFNNGKRIIFPSCEIID